MQRPTPTIKEDFELMDREEQLKELWEYHHEIGDYLQDFTNLKERGCKTDEYGKYMEDPEHFKSRVNVKEEMGRDIFCCKLLTETYHELVDAFWSMDCLMTPEEREKYVKELRKRLKAAHKL